MKISLKIEELYNFEVWNIGMVRVLYNFIQDYLKKGLTYTLKNHEHRNDFEEYF